MFLAGFGGSQARMVSLLFHLASARLSLGALWNGPSMPSFSAGRSGHFGTGRTKGVYSFSTLGWFYFVPWQCGGWMWCEQRKNLSCALHPQPAPEPPAGNSGLCVCIFWLSENPGVECFCSCVPGLRASLSGPLLPGNKTPFFFFNKTTSISEFTTCRSLVQIAPTWHALTKTANLKDPFHCCLLTLTLCISCKKEDSLGKIFLLLQSLNLW